MGSDRNPSLVGWWLTATLLLLTPLVQGGTPRLPSLVVNLGILSLVVFWAGTWARTPRRELRLNALDALLGFLVFLSLFSTLFAPYYHPAKRPTRHRLLCRAVCVSVVQSELCRAFHRARRGQGAGGFPVVPGARGGDRLLPGPPRGDLFQPQLSGRLPRRCVPPGRRRPDLLPDWLTVGARCARRSPPPKGSLLLAALLTTGSRGGTLALAAGLPAAARDAPGKSPPRRSRRHPSPCWRFPTRCCSGCKRSRRRIISPSPGSRSGRAPGR